jgi:hypothetical protein
VDVVGNYIMTAQEFKKNITKASWFDKYYYYFISFAVIGVGFLFLYLAFFEKARHQTTNSRILITCAALIFFFLGGISLYLIPNRYKILIIDSKASIDKKKKVIADTMKDFDAFFLDHPKQFWSFNYQRGWWRSDYNVYLTFDNDKILASVVGGTRARGGFIDFGQTERFRKKLTSVITEKLDRL